MTTAHSASSRTRCSAAEPFGLRRPFLAEPDLAPRLVQRVEQGSAASELALDLLGRLARAPVISASARRASSTR